MKWKIFANGMIVEEIFRLRPKVGQKFQYKGWKYQIESIDANDKILVCNYI